MNYSCCPFRERMVNITILQDYPVISRMLQKIQSHIFIRKKNVVSKILNLYTYQYYVVTGRLGGVIVNTKRQN